MRRERRERERERARRERKSKEREKELSEREKRERLATDFNNIQYAASASLSFGTADRIYIGGVV